MSSQAVNTSAYAGYTSTTAVLGQIPTRDSSDVTRAIREKIVYNENKVGSPFQPGAPEASSWQKYGNKYRLSYLFGRLKCTNGCGGTNPVTMNAFGVNGAYSTVPGGTFGGS